MCGMVGRALYRFIRRARGPVNREQAAASVGISRKLAAFHLDKLIEVGLLRATRERVGAGAQGRPHDQHPEHQHDLLAEILLDAVINQRADENAQQTALRLARQHGEQRGQAERDRVRPGRLSAQRALTLTESVLAAEVCPVAGAH